jgi:hypothetical protein
MIHGGINTMDKYLLNPPKDNTTVTKVAIPGYENFGDVLFSVFRLTLVDDYPYDVSDGSLMLLLSITYCRDSIETPWKNSNVSLAIPDTE